MLCNPMEVYLSHTSLSKWTDSTVLAEGRAMSERGCVEDLEIRGDMLTATVTAAGRPVLERLCAGLEAPTGCPRRRSSRSAGRWRGSGLWRIASRPPERRRRLWVCGRSSPQGARRHRHGSRLALHSRCRPAGGRRTRRWPVHVRQCERRAMPFMQGDRVPSRRAVRARWRS